MATIKSISTMYSSTMSMELMAMPYQTTTTTANVGGAGVGGGIGRGVSGGRQILNSNERVEWWFSDGWVPHPDNFTDHFTNR
uniref:Uncharacterized protein n=1 Tax=Romanomermis culicivorax TaxID=13658 RepID=A0A915K4A4_ROMCU